MNVLIVGGTGATGRLLVKELTDRGIGVRAIVRSPDRLPEELRGHPRVQVITGSILEIPDPELAELLRGCDAVASCLGHTLSLRGVFGPPRKLVTQAVRRLCLAIQASLPEHPIRFVLMNTAGNRNRDLPEKLSRAERGVMSLIRLLIPPQADNEGAAEFLRIQAPLDHPLIEWVVVRPDTLSSAPIVKEYEVFPSPMRSPLFNPGKTSRANVAHFMAELINNETLWGQWRGRMPVIYDKSLPLSQGGKGSARSADDNLGNRI